MNEIILNKKKFFKGLIVSIIIGIITTLTLISITTNQNTWRSLSYINIKFLLLGFSLMIFAAIVNAFRIQMAVESVYEKISFKEALKVYYISNFAGSVTPFFTGTLPAQIFLFNKIIQNKIPLGKATMIATVIPLLKTLVFTIFTPIIFFLYRKTVNDYTVLSIIFIDAAILISLFLLFLFFWAVKYPEKMIKIFLKIQNLPCISKLFKKEKISHIFDKVILEINEFHRSFYLLKENWIKLLFSFFFTVIFWSTFFIVAPLLLWGFDLNFNLSHVLVMQVIFYFILPFMPTPGGSGTAEIGFASLFSFFVPYHLLGIFIGAWRIITFYLNLGIGVIVLLVELKKIRKNRKK